MDRTDRIKQATNHKIGESIVNEPIETTTGMPR
jgi:hypothetical protein